MMTDKQPVTENLPTIAELRAEIIIELTCDTEDERDDCIDAKLLNDRLTVAEAVREACAKAVPRTWLDPLLTGPDRIAETFSDGNSVERLIRAIERRIRAIDLAEIVKGNP